MVRNVFLILFALLIDGMQALFSAALFVIGAFPGTVAGGATGAAAGAAVAGKVGATVGGFLGGLVGTPLDAFAPATLPLAIGMGFAINFCIDITFGTVLTMFLLTQGMYYPKYGIGGWIMEMIPGLNDLPGWTLMTVLSIVRKSAEEGKLQGTPAGLFTKMMGAGTLAGAGASFITSVKQQNMELARSTGSYTEKQQKEVTNIQQNRIVNSELKNIDGIRASQRPQEPINDSEPQKLKYAA